MKLFMAQIGAGPPKTSGYCHYPPGCTDSQACVASCINDLKKYPRLRAEWTFLSAGCKWLQYDYPGEYYCCCNFRRRPHHISTSPMSSPIMNN